MKNIPKIKPLSQTTTKIIEQKFQVNDYICFQKFENEALVEQYFTTSDPKKTHPFAFEQTRMKFMYYGPHFTEHKDVCFNRSDVGDDIIYPSQLFVDIETFTDYKNLICNWVGMDGDIYKITDKYPITTYKYVEIWDSLYNLSKVEKYLKTLSWVRDIEINKTPYYNREICGVNMLNCEAKIPQKKYNKMLSDNRSKNYINFSDMFCNTFLEKFRI